MGSNPTPVSPEALLAEVEWVRRVARALVGRGESDEVVQQTYLQALSTPPAPGPVRRWLSTVVRNVVRRRARDEVTRGRHEARAPTPARTPEPSETVERAELHQRVVEAVLALDEPYRSTLLLRFFEDQPADAIARAQALPVETVRTRVKRGLAQLRTRLERAAGGDDAAGMAARALWFERLGAFAGDGTKGALAGGAVTAAATGATVMVVRATWIATGLAAAVVVGAAAWWLQARIGASSVAVTMGRAVVVAREPSPAVSPRATRTAEAAAPAPPPVAGTPFVGGNRGVVRGRVRDANGNPIAGAEVRAMRSKWGGWFEDLESYALESWRETTAAPPRPLTAGVVATHSDESGRFEFDALSTIPDWCIGVFDPARGAALSDPFHFDQDEATHEVELTLIPGSVVRGHVRDGEGRPVVDATVEFGVARGKQSTWTGWQTGPDGSWRAGFVSGERVGISVDAPGFDKSPLQWTELAKVEHELVLDVVLRPNGDRLVSGPIVDASGAAVDLRRSLDALFGPEGDELRFAGTQPIYGRVAMGAASAEGQQPVLGARVASYRVVGGADLAASRYTLMLPDGFHGTLFLAVHGVCVGVAAIESVANPPPLPLDLKFAPARRATSRVFVRVVDAATNAPLDLKIGHVMATAPLPTHMPYGSIAAPDAQLGVAEFVISPARLSVRAELAGYAPSTAEIVVGPDDRHCELTIPLERATAGLRGRALRCDGSPIQQSSVALFRVTPNGVVEVTGSGSGTNAYGEFEIVGLAAAEHIVVVTAPDEACAVARVRAADPPTEFELHAVPGTRTEILLRPPPDNQGMGTMYRIVDEEGIPVVNTFGGWRSSAGDVATIEAILRPGSYRILVWRPRFHEATCSFDVPSDEPIEVELEPAR